MFNINKPQFLNPPQQYDASFFNTLLNTLRLYVDRLHTPQRINITQMNIIVAQLPTQADVANLRSGDVYRDTTAGNVLKIVP